MATEAKNITYVVTFPKDYFHYIKNFQKKLVVSGSENSKALKDTLNAVILSYHREEAALKII